MRYSPALVLFRAVRNIALSADITELCVYPVACGSSYCFEEVLNTKFGAVLLKKKCPKWVCHVKGTVSDKNS
jgi:hypothetical protein